MTLRNAILDDIAEIVDINRSYLSSDSEAGFLIRELEVEQVKECITRNPDSFIVGQNIEGEIVGFIMVADSIEQEIIEHLEWFSVNLRALFEQYSPKKYIEMIAVKRNYQRQKIGSSLYKYLFRRYPKCMFYAFVVLKPLKNSISLNFT
ncbi:MAG: GNAT family N-acetyltransferase [Planctomycetota bacterium]|jgi:ribosomal protein S18 acetylase RimI-like enzyme